MENSQRYIKLFKTQNIDDIFTYLLITYIYIFISFYPIIFRLLIVDTTATMLVILIKLSVVALGLCIGFFYVDKSKVEDILTTVTPFVVKIMFIMSFIFI